jgi:RNA polymerase sigma factor (sigma-70 family)
MDDLVEQCKLNNERAQALLFNNLSKPMTTFAKKFFNNVDIDTINDIIQDTFIIVFRDINKFNGNSIEQVTAWISVIIRNKCMDIHRGKKRIKHVELVDNILDKIEDDFIYEKYIPYIDGAIEKLSPKYKDVFILYYKEELMHKEISLELGIQVGTSKSNLMKARNKIKNTLLKLKNID